jgi:hypothetical protein
MRPMYHEHYYSAFYIDPDGIKCGGSVPFTDIKGINQYE